MPFRSAALAMIAAEQGAAFPAATAQDESGLKGIRFDVVSIRPSQPGLPNSSWGPQADGYHVMNWAVGAVIRKRRGQQATPGLSIFAAVQEQLGLKLEPTEEPLDVVAIEHTEKPSENLAGRLWASLSGGLPDVHTAQPHPTTP